MNLCVMLITRSGSFNYDPKFKGATAKSLSSLHEDKELSKDGFLLNHSRNLVGSGLDAYEKGKTALQDWRSANVVSRLKESQLRKENVNL